MLLVSACLILPALGPAGAQETGVSVGGVSVGVDTSNGLGVGASVGGSNGVNASANVGGSSLADVDATVGGADGVNASVDADISDGVDVDATASIGGSNGVNAGAGVRAGGGSGGPGAGGAGADLTPAQREAFNAMSEDEQRRLLNRCGDLLSSGTDAELAALCRMLRMTAQR